MWVWYLSPPKHYWAALAPLVMMRDDKLPRDEMKGGDDAGIAT